MKRDDFASGVEEHFHHVADELFLWLVKGEQLSLGLEAENSLYLRFNGNRIRQNTNVEQMILSFRLQTDGRTIEKSRTLSGDLAYDVQAITQLLDKARTESKVLPKDPNQIPMENFGTSRDQFRAKGIDTKTLIDEICGPADKLDLAGLYCGGPAISAHRNSEGQQHWFSSDSFFLDYSLYDGKKAAKSVYSESRWTTENWKSNLLRTQEQLKILSKPLKELKPGSYRTYLAPGAVSELLSLMAWNALSAAAWKQGRSPFKRLADGESTLSPLFNLKENFGLGLAPRFNAYGEVSPESVSLIERGKFQQFLVSSRTAKEYGLAANFASEGEGLRSPEILPGSLAESEILNQLGTGLYVSNLHYLNWSDPVSARVTGMTRYACYWVEKGEIVGPIKDLRFDESLYEALGPKLINVGKIAEIDPQVSTYGARTLGGRKIPGLLIDSLTFTL